MLCMFVSALDLAQAEQNLGNPPPLLQKQCFTWCFVNFNMQYEWVCYIRRNLSRNHVRRASWKYLCCKCTCMHAKTACARSWLICEWQGIWTSKIILPRHRDKDYLYVCITTERITSFACVARADNCQRVHTHITVVLHAKPMNMLRIWNNVYWYPKDVDR